MPATATSVRRVRDRVATAATQVGAARRVVEDVRLCVSEAVTNVVRHAYETGVGRVEVSVQFSESSLNVVVRDDGRGIAGRLSRDGFGFRVIDALADRYVVSSSPRLGTEVSMTFPLQRERMRGRALA